MKITAWIVNKFRYYVVFSKAIMFVLGLVFSYSLAEDLVVGILITHLTDAWKDENLAKAALVVTLSEGTSKVLQIFFVFVADASSGRFKMLFCSTIAYTIGLMLSSIASRKQGASTDEYPLNLRMFCTALVLITLAKAANKVTLRPFLDDQVLSRDQLMNKEEKEERVCARSGFWWYSVISSAVIIAIVAVAKFPQLDSFWSHAMVSTIAMGVAFLWFLLGIKFYEFIKPTGSPLMNVPVVIYTAITKRNVEYPRTPQQLFQNSTSFVQILPHISWLRWLDKAAVLQQEKEKPGSLCTVAEIKEVKFLLKMLPMWTTFLTFSVVAATGNTFILEETSNTNYGFPVQFYMALQSFTKFVVERVSSCVVKKLGKRDTGQMVMLVRIGLGMTCSMLYCVAAHINAVAKQASFFTHVPQYLLLGLMEGLAVDGLENFFGSQVSQSLARYGPEIGECVLGVGKFLGVICIVICEWFLGVDKESDCLDDHKGVSKPSCLDDQKGVLKPRCIDKYYAVLGISSFVNLIFYCLVAYWYGDNTFPLEESDVELGDGHVAEPQVWRSHSDIVQYYTTKRSFNDFQRKTKSFSGAYLNKRSFGHDIARDIKVEGRPEARKEERVALLRLKTDQETASSSPDVFPREADQTVNPDIKLVVHPVSVLPDGQSAAPSLSGTKSFSRMSSNGIQKRVNSGKFLPIQDLTTPN